VDRPRREIHGAHDPTRHLAPRRPAPDAVRHGEDWTWRLPEDALRHRAEHQSLEPRAPMRPHDDQPALRIPRLADDLADVLSGPDAGSNTHAGIARGTEELVKVLRDCGMHSDADTFRGRARRSLGVGPEQRRKDEEPDDFRPEGLRQPRRPADRRPGERREVDGTEDAAYGQEGARSRARCTIRGGQWGGWSRSVRASHSCLRERAEQGGRAALRPSHARSDDVADQNGRRVEYLLFRPRVQGESLRKLLRYGGLFSLALYCSAAENGEVRRRRPDVREAARSRSAERTA